MRLGQLARKLAMRPAEIVTFLAANNITIEEGSNTRLQDDHASMIMKHFAPSRMDEVMTEPDELEESGVLASDTFTPGADLSTPVQDEISNSEPVVIQAENEKTEVIRAAKVELPGLKVLGKIEFPEIKKKEPASNDTPTAAEVPTSQEVKKPRQELRKGSPKPERRDQRPKKNPIALQREQEAMEAERKKKAEVERQKELRTQHYLKKVKPAGPTKAMRLMDDPVEEAVTEKAPAPKTIFGKFLRWLTT